MELNLYNIIEATYVDNWLNVFFSKSIYKLRLSLSTVEAIVVNYRLVQDKLKTNNNSIPTLHYSNNKKTAIIMAVGFPEVENQPKDFGKRSTTNKKTR